MSDDALLQVENDLAKVWPLFSEHRPDNSDEKFNIPVNKEWHNFSLPSLRARALKNKISAQEYRNNLVRAHNSIEHLFEAVHQTGKFGPGHKKPAFVWVHRNLDVSELTIRAGDETRGFEIDKADLLQTAASYLAHPEISNNMLDWQFLDAIVFQELDAYAYHVFYERAGLGLNWAAFLAGKNLAKYYGFRLLLGTIGFVLRYLAFPALAIFLLIKGYGIWAGVVGVLWAFNIFLKIINFPTRRRTLKKALKLLTNLTDLYRVLGNSTISPRKLREILDQADTAGVALDGSVFTLVDRMLARDATAFIPTQTD